MSQKQLEYNATVSRILTDFSRGWGPNSHFYRFTRKENIQHPIVRTLGETQKRSGFGGIKNSYRYCVSPLDSPACDGS